MSDEQQFQQATLAPYLVLALSKKLFEFGVIPVMASSKEAAASQVVSRHQNLDPSQMIVLSEDEFEQITTHFNASKNQTGFS